MTNRGKRRTRPNNQFGEVKDFSEEIPTQRKVRTPTATPPFMRLLSFTRDHGMDPLVAIPLIGALLASFKIFVVSAGDRATFLHLAKTLNIQGLLVSVLTPIVWMLSLAALIAWTIWFPAHKLTRAKKSGSEEFVSPLRLAASGSALPIIGTAFFLLPAIMVILATFLGILWGAYSLVDAGSDRESTSWPKGATSTILPMILVVFLNEIVSGSMWLPAESANIGPSVKPSKIYALQQSEDQITFLDATAGKVRTIPLSELKSRQTCDDLPQWANRPLLKLRKGTTSYSHDRCP
ncbi:hypothetical protein [Micromonospora carbonacea]|uniref:Uncharacterized protein n=1 Tax=Micromonospora carbonacea TaxID=47853 RepID=A0A7H8XT70_9ACTN|nr:hypothetical protein [Micromonospora carbonacea]MBB5824738.1 hypothetical protein [Micromonospora carbonacea]QLD27102.1 hypothetical protein HXZ27_25245 [Micromonospora carbonacea]